MPSKHQALGGKNGVRKKKLSRKTTDIVKEKLISGNIVKPDLSPAQAISLAGLIRSRRYQLSSIKSVIRNDPSYKNLPKTDQSAPANFAQKVDMPRSLKAFLNMIKKAKAPIYDEKTLKKAELLCEKVQTGSSIKARLVQVGEMATRELPSLKKIITPLCSTFVRLHKCVGLKNWWDTSVVKKTVDEPAVKIVTKLADSLDQDTYDLDLYQHLNDKDTKDLKEKCATKWEAHRATLVKTKGDENLKKLANGDGTADYEAVKAYLGISACPADSILTAIEMETTTWCGAPWYKPNSPLIWTELEAGNFETIRGGTYVAKETFAHLTSHHVAKPFFFTAHATRMARSATLTLGQSPSSIYKHIAAGAKRETKKFEQLLDHVI